MTFCEIERILRADNWILIRVLGSHYQYRKSGVPNAIVIQNRDSLELTVGTIKDLEKKTGLSLRR